MEERRSFWKGQWAITLIGGGLVTVVGGIIVGVVLPAINSGHTSSSSGPAGSPSPLHSAASRAATTPAPGVTAGLYHQGTLALAYGGCADLDAPASDPQWGELSAANGGGGADLCAEYPGLAAGNNASLVAVSSGTDSTCQNATGWIATSGYYQDLNLSVGSFVCVHTNQGRYSLLRVVSINSADSSIVFWVRTFRKPGDPAASTESGSSKSGAQGIYHQGTLGLAYGGCADLDAPPSDPQWGESSAANGGGGADLCAEYPGLAAGNNASLVAVSSGTDTTCQNATGWIATSGYYQNLNLSVGSFVCVHTNQGRYSLLRVVSINSANSSIVFWAKTFKRPGD